ncbi:mediator of RNA polymerase II transcription subunit 7 [Neocloeon triangulifer]|uniref:mediator of RNA polymerase II transcription subunit 7 n=1 Tax=Neocloeon triangulifer TaxID=2078957 RepID=UPI00286F05BB|nr:mediator of RNA polymerase II transcription subunit 7 [Neocloeon triangulifer]
MANAEASNVSSAFPLPPANYYSHYTDENIRRGRVMRPPNPVMESYTMFGTPYQTDDSIIRPLESQGIRRLYPQNCDRRRELRKLNHSLLVNFLDLLDLLVQCPESSRRAEKVDDLSLLFIHIHHLLNEFRPHQARETLRVMMELQKRQRLETAARFQKHLEKVMEILDQALQMLPDNEELDSKLLIPMEDIENMDVSSSDDSKNEACSTLDRMMCEIVDAL